MNVFLKRRNGDAEAQGIYDESTGTLTVLKGSKVSDQVHRTDKFRSANAIEETREKFVNNGIVKEDVLFKSPSTAANFVTGSSTNGLTAWKTKDGVTLKEAIKH